MRLQSEREFLDSTFAERDRALERFRTGSHWRHLNHEAQSIRGRPPGEANLKLTISKTGFASAAAGGAVPKSRERSIMETNKKAPDGAFERSSKLPDEIIDAERSRSDYLKWKLLLVAVLGAAGFGLSEKARPMSLILALIPFVCLYVDLLCTNLNLRILTIGTFYATERRDPYERFVSQNRHAFPMEDWALYGSTCVVSGVLMLIGFLSLLLTIFVPPQPSGPVADGVSSPALIQVVLGLVVSAGSPTKARVQPFWQWPLEESIILVLAGLAGIGLCVIIRRKYNKWKSGLLPGSSGV